MLTTYDQKCHRFNELRTQMAAILDAPREAGAGLSTEEAAQFDTLATEAKALKAEIVSADEGTRRRRLLTEMDEALDLPRSNRPSADQIHEDLTQARNDFARGRYSLRFFARDNGREYESAYDSGLCLLARCGTGGNRDWALARIKERGLQLATITPFMGEDGSSSGGYLVFPQFEANLINLKEKYGIVEQNAFRIPMASDTLIVPRRAGGTAVYYPGENAQLTASAMQFDQVQLIARKYAQLALWSTELNEDSLIAMADLLAGEMAYQFAKSEDFNAAQGDGSANFAGVVGFLQALAIGKNGVVPTASLVTGTGTSLTVTGGGGVSGCINGAYSGSGYTTCQAFAKGSTANGAGFNAWNAVVANLPVYAEARAKWYMHKTVFWQMIAPVIEAAGGNVATYLTSGVPLKFLGYDVQVMQAMPTSSQLSGSSSTPAFTIPAVLGDMGNTTFLGVRRGVTARSSDQRFIEFDQIALQCTQRVAINNVVGDSVAPALQAGPMVGLQLPSS